MPGTTRDIVSSELFYESNSFAVFDSAGLEILMILLKALVSKTL